MKLTRIALAALLVLVALLSAGCMKTWSLDFTNNTGGWNSLIGWEDPGINSCGDYGLLLSGVTLMGNYGFTGNVEYSVTFDLDVAPGNELEKFEIYLGNGTDPAAQFLKVKFEQVGNSSSEYYAMFDNGTKIHDAIYIPGTVYSGSNTVKIVVEEGFVSFYMNNAVLYEDYAIGNYSAPFLVPYVFVQQGSPEEDEELLMLKSLKVKYSGDKQSMFT